MLLLYCLLEKKVTYILDVTLDVIIVQDASLILDNLYILQITINNSAVVLDVSPDTTCDIL
jgi:hypothetical protein